MKRNKLIGLFLVASLSVAGIYDSNLANVKSSGDELNGVRLWTTYNTYTVLQDPATMALDYVTPPEVLSEGEDLSLEIKMGRGEDEGAQLIITPEKDVQSYNVTVSDLTCGENVIPKEDIEIFNQYYSYISMSYQNIKYVPTGMTPDYLIPMDWAVAYGENTIKGGNNQGVTIEVESQVDTAPGVYTGTVTLTLDNQEREIPLSVTVVDVDLSESTMPITVASLGEIYDRTAYEKIFDYRVMGQYMFHGNSSPDAMVEELRRYYDEPRFSCYEIPNVNEEVFESYVRAIALACDADQKNYFTKALCYLQLIDESHDLNLILNTTRNYVNRKNSIISQLGSLMPNSSATFRQAVAESISSFPLYSAIRQVDWGNLNPAEEGLTFCMNYYDCGVSEEVDKYYSDLSATRPLVYSNNYFPAIANSLPNYGQSNRYMGWANQKYDYAGMLLWAANEITTEITANRGTAEQYKVREYFDDQVSWSTNYGGANFIVPAKKYGYPLDWVVSLRLAAMRDAVEDHNLITALEKSYATLAKEYGVTMDFDDCIDLIYKRAFYTSYTYHIDSGATLYEMREMIFDLIELANGNSKMMLAGGKLEGNKATMSFYANADTVKVNGQSQTAQNKKYTYTWNLNETDSVNIELAKAGETETFNARMFSYGTTKSVLDNVTLTNDKIANYAQSSTAGGKGYIPAGTVSYDTSKQAIKFGIPKAEGTALQMIGYAPKFTLDASLFGVEDFYDVSYVSMKIRVKYRSGEAKATVPLTIKLTKSASETLNLWTVLFDEDSYVGNGWHERYVTFRVDKHTLVGIKKLTFSFDRASYTWSKTYMMGADVEVSDIHYSLCQYPNKGVN